MLQKKTLFNNIHITAIRRTFLLIQVVYVRAKKRRGEEGREERGEVTKSSRGSVLYPFVQ